MRQRSVSESHLLDLVVASGMTEVNNNASGAAGLCYSGDSGSRLQGGVEGGGMGTGRQDASSTLQSGVRTSLIRSTSVDSLPPPPHRPPLTGEEAAASDIASDTIDVSGSVAGSGGAAVPVRNAVAADCSATRGQSEWRPEPPTRDPARIRAPSATSQASADSSSAASTVFTFDFPAARPSSASHVSGERGNSMDSSSTRSPRLPATLRGPVVLSPTNPFREDINPTK